MTLRKSCDMCIERKRNNVDLDELCNMIEQTDRYTNCGSKGVYLAALRDRQLIFLKQFLVPIKKI